MGRKMNLKGKKIETIVFRMESEKAQRLRLVAVKEKKSISKLLNELVDKYLEQKGESNFN